LVLLEVVFKRLLKQYFRCVELVAGGVVVVVC
jgi:hypothetical protein